MVRTFGTNEEETAVQESGIKDQTTTVMAKPACDERAFQAKPASSEKARVVIIGGGFAGIEAAKRLAKHQDLIQLTVIDRRNYHLFQPLLYQVATAGLNPADISQPIRSMLTNTPSVEVLMANVEKIDVHRKLVFLDHAETVPYDYLIVASGAEQSYFGHPEWEEQAPGLKSVEDATEIRRRILIAFEEAERSRDPEEKKALLTFVIVGGGPTGIELAGAISELSRHALARDFNHIDPALAQVILVEAGPKILAGFPDPLPEKAKRNLEDLGVRVELGKRVTDITEDGITMGKEFLPAKTVIWAAGVQASNLGKDLGAPRDRMGRILVNPDLSVPGHPEVFVAGDLAAVKWEEEGWVPGMAPAAMQGGRRAADNIRRLIEGKETAPFVYRHKGSMATIGRARAVADVKRAKLSGPIAWLAWLVIHIFYLVGFRNRILVLFQWIWSYVTYKRGARLITGDTTRALSAAQGNKEKHN